LIFFRYEKDLFFLVFASRQSNSGVSPILTCKPFFDLRKQRLICLLYQEKYMTLDPKTNTASSTTPSASSTTPAAYQNHVKAAEHCDAASASHKEAAKHVQSGDVKQAGQHAAVAQGHMTQAKQHSDIACKKSSDAAAVVK
jgi:hypothetical protein